MSAGTLISAEHLAARIPADNVLILDCRWELGDPDSGRRAHEQGHIPGAIHVNLDTELSDLSRQGMGRHPLPSATDFANVLSKWGWQPGRHVVAYDNAGGALAAARLWWMLRLVGSDVCRVLDGGYSAWQRSGLPVATDIADITPRRVSVVFDEDKVVGYDALQRGLADASICLVDARGGPRYRGETEPLDRLPGHVPGAVNRPFADNLDDDGCFRSPDRLAREFLALIGTHPAESVVHMCGSGVTACHNLLAMEHAGLHGSRVFAPSWSGWISDPARPVRTGAEP
ncbi:sulfurtransferase [Dokdonella sp.]|uniref:sulfurtransferase n=1 Tax=Dokdonella sp. TaxID=2291710 RepID=UPI003529BEB9